MKSQEGQALIEAIIALSLAAITVSVVVFSVVSSLANSTQTKQQSLAGQYARQGVDVVRNIRDKDYVGFENNYAGTYCLSDSLPLTLRNGPCTMANGGVEGNLLIRQIDIGNGSCSGGKLVTSKVSWTDNKCPSANTYCRNVTLRTCLATNNFLNP